MSIPDHHVSSSTDTLDPFRINEDHIYHIDTAKLINIESSGRTLCLTCLSNSTHENLETIEYDIFENHVRSIFELLQEHCDNKTIRKVALPVLEIYLKKRTLLMRSDHDFHNILKVLYKVRNHKHFNRYEFTQIARIFSSLCSGFHDTSKMPLLSVWDAADTLMDYAEQQLGQIPFIHDLDLDLMLLFEAVCMIVSSYLCLINSFRIDDYSGIILPLTRADKPDTHNRARYRESQLKCLKFIKDTLIAHCWPAITNDLATKTFRIHEINLVSEIYVVFRECFITGLRFKDNPFSADFEKLDIILVSHQCISKSHDQYFRLTIRAFLKTYVAHHINEYVGTDETIKTICFSKNAKIESNFRNASYTRSTQAYDRTLNYLLLNYLAMKKDSSYFRASRVKSVMKLVQPGLLQIDKSRTLMRVYLYLLANLAPNVMNSDEFDTSKSFVLQYFMDSFHGRIDQIVNEIIASDEQLFFWGMGIEAINLCMDVGTLAYLLENHVNDHSLDRILVRIINEVSHQRLLNEYLKDCDSSIDIIERLCNQESEYPESLTNKHKTFIEYLNGILPALLHESVLLNAHQALTPMIVRNLDKLLRMITMLMNNCRHFHLMLDDNFVCDLFKVHQKLCQAPEAERLDDTIINFNEFICCIILDNNAQLLKVLDCLNYYSMGYLLYFVTRYKFRDNLAESVASLLVTYDDLDYPLVKNIFSDLHSSAESAFYWFLSDNNDLNLLAMKLAIRIMSTDSERSAKVCIATGLLHLLVKDSPIWKYKVYQTIARTFVSYDEFILNPLIGKVKDNLPEFMKSLVEQSMKSRIVREDVFATFSGSDDDTDDTDASDSGETITGILTNLNQDDYGYDDPNGIPSSMMVSNSVPTRWSPSINADEWERRAQQHQKTVNPD